MNQGIKVKTKKARKIKRKIWDKTPITKAKIPLTDIFEDMNNEENSLEITKY